VECLGRVEIDPQPSVLLVSGLAYVNYKDQRVPGHIGAFLLSSPFCVDYGGDHVGLFHKWIFELREAVTNLAKSACTIT
jgi:hypothetical protein